MDGIENSWTLSTIFLTLSATSFLNISKKKIF